MTGIQVTQSNDSNSLQSIISNTPPSAEIISLLESLSSHPSSSTSPGSTNTSDQNNKHQSNLSSFETHVQTTPKEILIELCKVLHHRSLTDNKNYYETQIRPLAGIVLKNILIRQDVLLRLSNSENQNFFYSLGSELLTILTFPNESILFYNVVGSSLSAMYTSNVCPAFNQYLMKQLTQDHNDELLVRLFSMLEKILMDIRDVSQLQELIPFLLRTRNNERVMMFQLKCLKLFIPTMPSSLQLKRQEYLALLGSIGSSSQNLQALVCSSLVSLLSLHDQYISTTENFGPICDFIQHCSKRSTHNNSEVALEACEFWFQFCQIQPKEEILQHVQTLLPTLIPIFLENMVYTKEEIEIFNQEQLDEENEQKPVFYTSKYSNRGNTSKHAEDQDEDDDDELDLEDTNWTVRKCSAASLDSLSHLYGSNVILPIILPTLEPALVYEDPWIREASVLALGAIAHGCHDGMKEYLNNFFPFLVNNLSTTSTEATPQQLLVISCWTIGRYSHDFIKDTDSQKLMELWKILSDTCILNPNASSTLKLAAYSAWGVILESCYNNTAFGNPDFIQNIYQVLLSTLQNYKSTRLLLVLFDTFGILAEYLSSYTIHHVDLYLPPLLQLWNSFKSQHKLLDRTLLPFVDSLSSITLAIGIQIQPHVTTIFQFSIQTIELCKIHLVTSYQQEKYPEEECDAFISCLDLLDAVLESLQHNFATFLSSNEQFNTSFWNVLVSGSSHLVPGVRMSAFALLGDLARQCPMFLLQQENYMNLFLKELLQGIYNPMHISVCNNAVWAMGEIALQSHQHKNLLQPFSQEIVQALIPLLMSKNENEFNGIMENAACCMGRLASVDVQFILPDLYRFFPGWCLGLAQIVDYNEKRDGFQGLLNSIQTMISIDSSAFLNILQLHNKSKASSLVFLIFSIISWNLAPLPKEEYDLVVLSVELFNGDYLEEYFNFVECPEPDLKDAFTDLLSWIQTNAVENISMWEELLKCCNIPVKMRQLLNNFYSV